MENNLYNKNLANYTFKFVETISPLRENENVKTFKPQIRYSKRNFTELNAHGKGVFCKFTIHPKWKHKSGVYALFKNDSDLPFYIGQCQDLQKRFNQGYGNISPRNCYNGGQSTNCKINSAITEYIFSGHQVLLYFLETADYINIEKELIKTYKEKYKLLNK